MKLILAEKPSVAKNIAEALKIKGRQDGYLEGEGYIITWAFGHLLQLYDAKDYDQKMAKWKMENFPFLPDSFQYKVKSSPSNREKSDPGAVKQLKIIQSLIKRKDVDAIISACDYDREGQLIGDSIIYHQKSGKKVYRLLLNEWTAEEVLKGLQNLKPNETMRPLLNAGLSRQWTDWALGINLTSAATLKFQKGSGKALNIGRVLMPTLKIIYDRDLEIENFKPEKYYKLAALFKTNKNEQYEGAYTLKGQDKHKEKDSLDLLAKMLAEKTGVITEKKVELKQEYPPFLFNLSSLQGYITNKHKGWTSDKVLKIAQSLYEKKLITYPRTASIALEESLKEKTAKVLAIVKEDYPFSEEIQFSASKRIFNNKKVESHSAIIPTYIKPKKLSADEEKVYLAIKNRFVTQFMPVAKHEETKLETTVAHEGEKHLFHSKGRVQITEGWRKAESIQTKDSLLPKVELNEQVTAESLDVKEQETKPPKPHSEMTLLKVMETCGRAAKNEEELVGSILAGYSIGTPATRADTIKKLKEIGYIYSESKSLRCTELGKKLVETLPVKELFDLEFTGRLEKYLFDIQKNKMAKEQFLAQIYQFTKESVEKIKGFENVILSEGSKLQKKKEVLGSCPLCGKQIVEGLKGYGCSGWKQGCKFVIWKNDKFLASMQKKVTKTMVKTLLKNKSVTVKGLKSKKGNSFDAVLKYEKNSDNDYFSWKMEFLK
ncbi:DNA topoisomerase [Metabacillus sp. GX 13764]|uniref:type IA DNA topoisomerase n=1 Tax=Metabacillus kandeliae TaxID=2900151 RepID=UPI001E29BC16|nr:type IA DNA topoisomerase [Metabacillus kandeliae]MCD7033564.1 DNA topoisomerase [Metabacillus kandeliae]